MNNQLLSTIDEINLANLTLDRNDLIKSQILDVNIDYTYPHKDNVIYNKDKIEEMKESISNIGQQTPAILSFKGYDENNNPKYLVLSGHTRREALIELGIKTIKAIVLENLTSDLEKIILYDTNIQRVKKPSEIALETKERVNLYMRNGMKRSHAIKILANEGNEVVSEKTIRRRLAQAELDEEQLEELDNGELRVRDVSKVLNGEDIEEKELLYHEQVEKLAKELYKKIKKII